MQASVIDSTKIVGNRISSACEPFPGVWAGGSLVDIQPIIVSGYAYQDRNDLPSYQEAPDGLPGELLNQVRRK